MKFIQPAVIALILSACGGKNNGTDTNKVTENSGAPAATISSESGAGSISCKIDGIEWKNGNASATQTGKSFLNIASDENQKEAISIIENHPATGTFNFNNGISGSYTDVAGKSFGSKDGSGTVVITGYTAPGDHTDGSVGGTFSGTFSFDTNTRHVITDGIFSMPVKKL